METEAQRDVVAELGRDRAWLRPGQADSEMSCCPCQDALSPKIIKHVKSDSGLRPHPFPDTLAPSRAPNSWHTVSASPWPSSLVEGAKKLAINVFIATI